MALAGFILHICLKRRTLDWFKYEWHEQDVQMLVSAENENLENTDTVQLL